MTGDATARLLITARADHIRSYNRKLTVPYLVQALDDFVNRLDGQMNSSDGKIRINKNFPDFTVYFHAMAQPLH